MNKTENELNEIKEEIETLNQKLSELSEEELNEVTGGVRISPVFVGLPLAEATASVQIAEFIGRPVVTPEIVTGAVAASGTTDSLRIIDGIKTDK